MSKGAGDKYTCWKTPIPSTDEGHVSFSCILADKQNICSYMSTFSEKKTNLLFTFTNHSFILRQSH